MTSRNDPVFVSLQGSYKQIEVALFCGEQLLDSVYYDNQKASALLLSYLDDLLKKHNLNVSDLSFIASDQGPGALTSLRITMAFLNGISFATRLPLIGVDGLDCLAQEIFNKVQNTSKNQLIVPLLNAFNKEVYFGIYKAQSGKLEQVKAKGYKDIFKLIEDLKGLEPKSFIFSGNGAEMYRREIIISLGNNAHFLDPIKPACSAKQVGLEALKLWKIKKDLSFKLLPLYLKTPKYKQKYG